MLAKSATVMFVYALMLIGIGALTFHVSPPGSKAITALLVPGIIGIAAIACGVLTLMGKRDRKLGLTGVYVGLLVPMIGAVGSFMRLGTSLASTEAFNAHLKETGAVIVSEDAKQHEKNTAYQSVGIGACGAISVLAFAALVLHRPTVPKRPDELETAPASTGSDPSAA